MNRTVVFVAKRLGVMFLLLVVLAAIVFVLQRFTPADPVRIKLGAGARPEIVAAERARLGYDRPIVVQFLDYLGGLVRGDLGSSLRTQRAVGEDISAFLPATAELIVYVLLFTALIGIPLGLLTARRGRGATGTRLAMATAAAVPAFLVVLLALIVFYRELGWIPGSGRTDIRDAPTGPTGLLTVDSLLAGRLDVFGDSVHHLLLPVLAAALAPAVTVARVLRSSTMGVLRTDYVRTARAKGLKEGTVLRRHALRNAAGPPLSITGLLVSSMFTGLILVEQLLSWPGLGRYTVQSIQTSDFPAIAGVTLVLGGLTIVINALVEVAQTVADPRLAL